MPLNQTEPTVPGVDTGPNSTTMIVHPSVLVDTSDNAFGIVANPLFVEQTVQSGYVAAYASNGAATAATTDYSFKWGAAGTTVISHLMVQNNTASSIQWDLDVTATAGSPVLAAGQTLFLDVQVTALHLYTPGISNVNGTSASNIVVRAWN